MVAPYAFVTLVSSDAYLPGALALAAALRDVHPSPPVPPQVPFQTVCLVTPETVDVSTIKLLRAAFNIVVGVEVIVQEDKKGLKLLGRPDLDTVLTKLHVFRLVQFSKIIFLDADILPIKSLSHLFTLPHEFSAVPDVGWPDIFNSGVLVLSPGQDKFTQLTDLLASKGSWDGGDQGILNEWRGGDWNRLSFTYNTTPTAAYTYAPAYERFGAEISAIHFIGPDKPWNSISYRAPFSTQSTPAPDSNQQAYDYNSLVDRWYAVYDKHYRSHTAEPQPQFEVKRYESAWNETAPGTQPTPAPPTAGSILSLEDLRKLAIEGVNKYGPPSDDKPGDGGYQSLPLDGRVDLMRPKKIDESEPKSPKGKDKEDRKRPEMLQDLMDPEDFPHTPMARHALLGDESPPRWQTLSTPAPHEIPASPRPPIISLPSTPTPYFPHSYYFPSAHHSPSTRQAPLQEKPLVHEHLHQPEEQRAQQQNGDEAPLQLPPMLDFQPQAQFHNEPEHRTQQQHPEHKEDPPRPRSPPMLVWNAAVDPPPTATPTPTAFPSDTYFQNIWDQTPSKQNDQPHQGSSPIPDSGGFFQPPPPSEIPEPLLRQGHYRNVTGEDHTPSPDRSKVKHVFPWEEKPRQLPGRVFPTTDSPTPSLFLSPESQASSSEVPTTPEAKPTRVAVLSPLYGLPSSLTYANAWDTIPSIQKYASRLVRPPPTRPLAPAFDDDGWRRDPGKSWDEKAEASSRDGDVEDEGEDSLDETAPDDSLLGEESDSESTKSLQRRSRRGSSVSMTHTIIGKREYRGIGIQTTSPVMQSTGVQTSPEAREPEKSPRKTKLSMSSKRHWAPSETSNTPPAATAHEISLGPDLSMTTAAPSPASTSDLRLQPQPGRTATPSPPQTPAVRSPHVLPPSADASRAKTSTPPLLKTAIRNPHSPSVVTRQASNDSSLGSPASSTGPMSPPDGQPVASPVRKGGRVWDPARGVDLFKRGSEEVLARFLKMGGSWEDETR